jgi:hypothetical protein
MASAGVEEHRKAGEGRVNIAVEPGIPSGQQTRLPAIAAYVLAWGQDREGSDDFSLVHEQVAYMLVEQASIVLWNCQQLTSN